MKWIMFFLLSIPVSVIAQDSLSSKPITGNPGIHFEQGLSWQEIKSKAKAEGKPIFMDCYATWCGPCKFMSQNIFTQNVVGDFMNENFISVAVQMDRISKDGDETKKWYADAAALGEKYSIGAYPTYLFFGPDGQPLHRVVGATGRDPNDFIAKVKEALDPNKQYYTQLEKFNLHLHDSSFLRSELIAALHSSDDKSAESLADAYFDCIRNLYDVESVNLVRVAMQSSEDKAFTFFLNHSSSIDSVLDKRGLVERTVANIIANEEITPRFENLNSIIDWSKINEEIKQKYPAVNSGMLEIIYQVYENEIVNKELRGPLAKNSGSLPHWNDIAKHIRKICPSYNPDSIIAMEKPRYYRNRNMWSLCDRATISCLKKYGNKLNTYILNSILWDYVFMHSCNHKLLSMAVEMGKKMVPDLSDTNACRKDQAYEYVDTYANLLYKMGMKDQAILWERAALNALKSDADDKSTRISFTITIAKMEKGESTWVGRSGAYEEFK